jgi:hypothetical protein
VTLSSSITAAELLMRLERTVVAKINVCGALSLIPPCASHWTA